MEQDLLWASLDADTLDEVLEDVIFNTDEENSPKHDGPRPGKAVDIYRERGSFTKRLHKDYFADIPIYPPHVFERRFRV